MYVDYDINTITARDYTVEFELSEKQYKYFIDNYHQPHNPISEINQLKIFIKDEIEKRINEFPDMKYDPPDERHLPKKIATITFAYKNS